MDDLISRQAATSIPILPKEHRKIFKSIDDAFETGWNEALSCVNMLPSAQQWIPCSERLPVMSRYIDADKLIKFANNSKDKTIDANDIARFPTADVRENTKAQKVLAGGILDGTTHWYECSCCHGAVDILDAYCKHCGAVLELENDL